MTTVVVSDDHTLLRESVVKLLRSMDGFDVAGEASSAAQTIELVSSLDPDLLLLDIGLGDGDGIEVASTLKKRSPRTRILFLTMHDGDAYLRRAIALGADGFVHKSSSTEELTRAIETVASGGTYLGGDLTRRALDLAAGRATGPAGTLTDRELEILVLVADGARPAEIASSLFISVKTVKNHLTHVYAKLGVETGAQAVAEAYRLGLVEAQH